MIQEDRTEIIQITNPRIENYVYCAVNNEGEVQEVRGSSSRITYFKTTKYLNRAVEYHNRYYPDNQWRVAKFKLIEEDNNVENKT